MGLGPSGAGTTRAPSAPHGVEGAWGDSGRTTENRDGSRRHPRISICGGSQAHNQGATSREGHGSARHPAGRRGIRHRLACSGSGESSRVVPQRTRGGGCGRRGDYGRLALEPSLRASPPGSGYARASPGRVPNAVRRRLGRADGGWGSGSQDHHCGKVRQGTPHGASRLASSSGGTAIHGSQHALTRRQWLAVR